MGELLGALGLAWPRLLLYPGGASAIVGAWLLARWLTWCARTPYPPGTGQIGRNLLDLVPPLVVLSLLPLAPARGFPYGLDLPVALALLEWPRLRVLTIGEGLERGAVVRTYGPVLLAAVGMASATGRLGLSDLLTLPEAWPERVLLLVSAGLWLTALPRLLAGGIDNPAGRLRALGLLLVGALPLLGAAAATTAEQLPPGWAGWVLPPAVIVAAALLLGGLTRLPARWRASLEVVCVGLVVGLVAI